MKNNKSFTKCSGYISRHLEDLENLPVNEGTLYLVDAITSIDRSLYRKDWFNVYKKCKNVVEHIERNIEINDEKNHYFLHCTSLVDSLYINAYSALSKVYFDTLDIGENEMDSIDEFVATVREKYGKQLDEIAPPPSKESAFKRLMVMTSSPNTHQYPGEMEKLIVELNDSSSNLEEIMGILGNKRKSKDTLIKEISIIVNETQSKLNRMKSVVHSDILK